MSDIHGTLARGAERLRQAGVASPRLDARVLLAYVLGTNAEELLVQDNIDADQKGRFEALISRRAAREPLAYIVGSKEFWSRNFEVGPGALIPRPETETLVEEALRAFPDRSASLQVLDLGTGTGCLLVTFLAEFPQARGTGIDASPVALAWAHRNAARHNVATRCAFKQSDWNNINEDTFDVVFANPPYLSEQQFEMTEPEIEVYEPREAFVGGPDGLDAYRMLGPLILRCLRQDGLAFLEIGAGQAEPVSRILEACSLNVGRVAADLARIPRCLVVGRAMKVTTSKKTLERA